MGQRRAFDSETVFSNVRGEYSVSPEPDCPRSRIVGDHRNDCVYSLARFLRRLKQPCPSPDKSLRARSRAVVEVELVSGFEQAAGHTLTHISKTDKGDSRHTSSPKFRPILAYQRWIPLVPLGAETPVELHASPVADGLGTGAPNREASAGFDASSGGLIQGLGAAGLVDRGVKRAAVRCNMHQ